MDNLLNPRFHVLILLILIAFTSLILDPAYARRVLPRPSGGGAGSVLAGIPTSYSVPEGTEQSPRRAVTRIQRPDETYLQIRGVRKWVKYSSVERKLYKKEGVYKDKIRLIINLKPATTNNIQLKGRLVWAERVPHGKLGKYRFGSLDCKLGYLKRGRQRYRTGKVYVPLHLYATIRLPRRNWNKLDCSASTKSGNGTFTLYLDSVLAAYERRLYPLLPKDIVVTPSAGCK